MSGVAIGSMSAARPLDLLGHLERGHAVRDQRLVDVEVEEADLGVGDPAQTLRVDANQLEEGDEREARLEGPAQCRIASTSSRSAALAAGRRPEEGHQALDQLCLEPGSPAASSRDHVRSGPGTGPRRSRTRAGPPRPPPCSHSSE